MPGIYIHIPFCKQACSYCDFHFSTSLSKKELFINALLKEIELQKNYLSIQRLHNSAASVAGENINSIYFGGGTPSVLNEKEINLIFEKLSEYFAIPKNAEVTLEANPDDISEDYLKSLKNTPINRLSIGVQSFSNADLRYMNRVHDAATALRSIKLALAAGFENISIDLIYGTPTMNHKTWVDNLQALFEMPVNHLSCYSLTVESRTPLYKMIRLGKTVAPEDQKSAAQFEILMQLTAENNFEHYEISSFSRNRKYSIHNSGYWRGESYLGLGPSAHSYNRISRQWNVANNSVYIDSLLKGKMPFEKEELTSQQKYNEYVMTSLRTKWGASIEKISKDFGVEYENYFKKESRKILEKNLLSEKENIFYLSEKGKLFADQIASSLFYIEHK